MVTYPMTFGFVGLGQMGIPMAHRLGRGHEVLAHDRKPGVLPGDHCARQVARIDELAACDCILLSLPSQTAQETVLFGTDGLAPKLRAGTIIVDTSTIGYNATLDMARRLEQMGLRFLDAPVSGMQKRAEDGTLTMMIGGDATLARQLEPALGLMADRILFMGGTGAGQLTKLINQLLFDINLAALAEILPVSVRLGLDPAQVAEVVNSGTGRSYASEFFLPNILKGIFDQGYPLKAAYKDLVSGAELGGHGCLPMPVLAAATATYQRALLEGHGDKDKGAMILVFEDLLGARFRAREEGDAA